MDPSLLVVPFVVALVVFEAYCLADLARAGDWELLYFNRWVWAFLCLNPFGAMLYWFRGRSR